MARTKHTARKATGAKHPRKKIAAGKAKADKQSAAWKKWCTNRIIDAEKYQDELVKDRQDAEKKNLEAERKEAEKQQQEAQAAAAQEQGFTVTSGEFQYDREVDSVSWMMMPGRVKGAETVVAEGFTNDQKTWKIYQTTTPERILVWDK